MVKQKKEDNTSKTLAIVGKTELFNSQLAHDRSSFTFPVRSPGVLDIAGFEYTQNKSLLYRVSVRAILHQLLQRETLKFALLQRSLGHRQEDGLRRQSGLHRVDRDQEQRNLPFAG